MKSLVLKSVYADANVIKYRLYKKGSQLQNDLAEAFDLKRL